MSTAVNPRSAPRAQTICIRDRTMLIHRTCAVGAAIAVGSFALAGAAAAHHPGGGGNAGGAGPIFTIPASTLEEGQTAVGVMFEYVRLRTLSA